MSSRAKTAGTSTAATTRRRTRASNEAGVQRTRGSQRPRRRASATRSSSSTGMVPAGYERAPPIERGGCRPLVPALSLGPRGPGCRWNSAPWCWRAGPRVQTRLRGGAATGINTSRTITTACDYYAPPSNAVVDEGDQNAPRGTTTLLPFALHCSYSTSSGEKQTVVHDMGTAPLVASVAILVASPLVWARRRRSQPAPTETLHTSDA